jgi:dUTP pyrophosphatase
VHNHLRGSRHDERGRWVRGSGLGSLPTLTKKHKFDAGLDVVASVDAVVEPGGRTVVKTDVTLAIPDGYVGLLWSRSGLSAKHGIEVGAGCIDSSYRGEILVVLYNYGEQVFRVKKGDRVAQLLTVPVNLEMYNEIGSIEDTDRGAGGFGSTDTGSKDGRA